MKNNLEKVDLQNINLEFKKECDEWLNPKGYFVHHFSSDYSQITYVDKDLLGPTITCHFNSGEKYISLFSSQNFKMCLSLVCNKLQFKHPDIDKFIEAIKFYENLAKEFQPKLY